MGLVRTRFVPIQNDRFLVTLKLLTQMSWQQIIDAYNKQFGEAALPGDARNRWARQLKANSFRDSLENNGELQEGEVADAVEFLRVHGLGHLNSEGERFLLTHSDTLSNDVESLPAPSVASAPLAAASTSQESPNIPRRTLLMTDPLVQPATQLPYVPELSPLEQIWFSATGYNPYQHFLGPCYQPNSVGEALAAEMPRNPEFGFDYSTEFVPEFESEVPAEPVDSQLHFQNDTQFSATER
ncbi:predicted protein [Uncinocarpus reesii 1704]|uniref:Clr5 domain-containing protein n=1 Tax=Uncinocarpus reesii (strain UAMH 1704) TaxID=336963 RepID=C4JWD5_UNCRE|nr:uncharacterized protein UREG_06877 [Uncinocarpus reesii 1704]EEP82012.1 predicted protein [Uncinocarpus reesii 1704]